MRMWLGIRIIPLTMFMALMLLGIKAGDVIRGSHEFSDMLIARRVEAEESKPAAEAEKKEPEMKEAEKKEGDKKEKEAEGKHAAKEEKKEGGEKKETAEKKDEGHGEKKEGEGEEAKGGGEKKEGKEGNDVETKKVEPEPKIDSSKLTPIERKFSPVEIEVLQSLSKRRDELEEWERNIQVKEQLLQIEQKRLDEKIQHIESLKKEAGEVLAQYNEREDAKIRSLVKIYENMKPKEAARIFEEMDMPVLLLVVDRMSEKKVAPILAGMDPTKAKQVTVELAEQRKLRSGALNAAVPQPQPPVQ